MVYMFTSRKPGMERDTSITNRMDKCFEEARNILKNKFGYDSMVQYSDVIRTAVALFESGYGEVE